MSGRIIKTLAEIKGYTPEEEPVTLENRDNWKGLYAVGMSDPVVTKSDPEGLKTKITAKIGLGGLSKKDGGLLRRINSYHLCFPNSIWIYAIMVMRTGHSKETGIVIDSNNTAHHELSHKEQKTFLTRIEEELFQLLHKYEIRTDYLTRVKGHYEWVENISIKDLRNAFEKIRDRYPNDLLLVFPSGEV